jgi:hypothetical protein
MNSARKSVVLLLFGTVLSLASGIQGGQDEWQLVKKTRAGHLYHRESSDSSIPWTMIAARFSASPERVHAMVTDYNHFSEFIPNVAESRVVQDAGSEQWVYHHLNFPVPVADRSYIIVSTDRDSRPGDGHYRVEWVLSDEIFPGVDLSAGVRPQAFAGFWEIQPGRDADSTEARYAVHSDPGGLVPGWLVSTMTDRYAIQVVQAIRARLASEQ